MKLGIRIFGCYLVIFCICFALPVGWVLDTLRTRYLEGVEDPLVDQAQILAGVVGQMMADGSFDPGTFYQTFETTYRRPLDIRIYNFTKTVVDPAVYITDAKGIVLFHSRNPAEIGADYGHWRDVSMTLEGHYGALVKRVAHLHSGAIKLQNRSSGGMRAVLTLPLKNDRLVRMSRSRLGSS
jgi:two-component system, OmpR family, sensor histidine kinase CreC